MLMATVLVGNAAPGHDPAGDAIPNRVLAFGDSITCGRIQNLRGQPIAGAQVQLVPAPRRVAPLPG